jgi:hypothetical protein
MLIIPKSQPATSRRAPRRNRWGGFVLSPETAGSWASRLYGEELHPLYDGPTICDVLLNEVRPYRVNFKLIGEVWPDEAQYMIVTQSAKFDGYKGMDPSEIPQFKEGEREAIARQLLEKAGASCRGLGLNCISDTTSGVKDYEFITFLRD